MVWSAGPAYPFASAKRLARARRELHLRTRSQRGRRAAHAGRARPAAARGARRRRTCALGTSEMSTAARRMLWPTSTRLQRRPRMITSSTWNLRARAKGRDRYGVVS